VKFKDYLIDRFLYIIVYYLSLALAILIMSLDLIIRDEELNVGNIIYAVLVSTVILVIYVALDYYKKKSVYQALNDGLNNEDDFEYVFRIPKDSSREHRIFKTLLTKNYMYFENTLDQYRRRFKDHMYYKSRWIHQMKTPVSVIKLILENQKDKDMDEDNRNIYKSIEEEIEKLSHGLEMELYALKINDFEMDFKIEDVDVMEIARTVINENKNAFIVNSIYPKLISDKKYLVKSDEKWLKFVINQLVSNAIKYTKIKDVENKYLHINLHRENDKVILSVKDNGIGIPSKDLDRVFRPFFTGENGRRHKESTGMGLYLAKEVCDRLGHGLEIKSDEGLCTTVNVIFYDGKIIYDLK